MAFFLPGGNNDFGDVFGGLGPTIATLQQMKDGEEDQPERRIKARPDRSKNMPLDTNDQEDAISLTKTCMTKTSSALVANIGDCERIAQSVKEVVEISKNASDGASLVQQMHSKLEMAERTVSQLNQCISDEMVHLTAEVSAAEQEVTASNRKVDKKEEEVKIHYETYVNAEVMCVKALKEEKSWQGDFVQMSMGEIISAIQTSALVLGIAALGGPIGLAIGYAFLWLTADRARKARMDRAYAAAQRLKNAEANFENCQEYLEECKAIYEEAESELDVELSAQVINTMQLKRIQALQKFIFSIGENMKDANLLVGKLSARAGTAAFMTECGTVKELIMVLQEMQTNFDQFGKLAPALAYN